MAEAWKGKMAKAQDPLEDAPDPTEDTPDDDSEDTADDQPEGSNDDWTPKDRREAQKKITEQGQELARLREQLEARSSDEDEDDDDTEDDPGDEVEAPDGRYEQDSWLLAESLYGEEAITAYGAAEKLMRKATTPADWVAAFEAYHRIRSGEGQQDQADAAPQGDKRSRDKALEPRVDTNRSDPSPDLTQNFEEARKSGSLGKFAATAAQALGFGPTKRT